MYYIKLLLRELLMGKIVQDAARNIEYCSRETYYDAFPGVDFVNKLTFATKAHALSSEEKKPIRALSYLGMRLLNMLSVPMNILAFAVAIILSPVDCCCGKGWQRIKASGKNLLQTAADLPFVFEIRQLAYSITDKKVNTFTSPVV